MWLSNYLWGSGEKVNQPLSPEAYQSGENHQLGTPVGIYTRRVTLSGKVAFTGITLLALFIIIDLIILVIDLIILVGSGSGSSFIESPLGFAQGIFLAGTLLSYHRHEELISPLHPKLSVSIYTEGLLYRKGRKIQVVRWEEIQSIRRQFAVYRRKGKITCTRPAYTCELSQKPDLVLSAAISDVDEAGVFIERELTKRLLPQIQADYQAGKPIGFSGLSLTRQYIGNREKKIDWERVSRVEVGVEKLVIEKESNDLDLLTVPITQLPNVCVLEVLLEDIQEEKGFELSLATETRTRDADIVIASSGPRSRQRPRKTSWVSSLVLALLVISGVALETLSVRDRLNNEQVTDFPSQTFQVSGPPTLVINVSAVDHIFVTNKDGDTNQVVVFGFKKVTGLGTSFDDIQEHATQNGDTIDLTWTMKQSTFFGQGSEKIDLFVEMPSSGNVQIETRTGEVVIGYITGEMSVKTQSGHIDVAATLQGNSQLQTTSGQIDYCGSLDSRGSDLFQSESGKITLTLPSDTAFSLSSSSSLNRLNNDFGSNEVGVAPRARLEVTTNTGVIAIRDGGSQLASCG